MGAALALWVDQLLAQATVRERWRWAAGFSAAITFIAQPIMLEMASWPFMVMQFLPIAMTVVSGLFLFRFAVGLDAKELWRAVLVAYASVHVFGVGGIFSLATLAVGGAVALGHGRARDSAWRRSTSLALAVGLGLTGLHALLMVMLPSSQQYPQLTAVGRKETLLRMAWLAMGSLRAGFTSLWGSSVFPWPSFTGWTVETVYASGTMLLLIGAAAWSAWRTRNEDPTKRGIHAMTAFTLVALLIYSASIALRLRWVFFRAGHRGLPRRLLRSLVSLRSSPGCFLP